MTGTAQAEAGAESGSARGAAVIDRTKKPVPLLLELLRLPQRFKERAEPSLTGRRR